MTEKEIAFIKEHLLFPECLSAINKLYSIVTTSEIGVFHLEQDSQNLSSDNVLVSV